MKKLSVFHKIIAVFNSLLAAILLISYLSYYISPKTIAFFSFISLSVPFLIILNAVFLIYWLFKLKKQLLISGLVLLLGFQYLGRFYGFEEKKVLLTDDIKIMSYNVRMFNLYNWIEDEETSSNIFDFINDKEPDILCIQEFHPSENLGIKYPYSYIKTESQVNNFGHAIFSNYKIIHSGSLNFSNSTNNAIYVDLLIRRDTIRVYNVHLESLKINPKEETLTQESSEKFKNRVQDAFIKQTDQALVVQKHIENTTFKSIVCGDFNNNAFSWAYHTIKSDKNDAFQEAGKGFGKTYNYPFPFRIDFILTDPLLKVHNFKTFQVPYSDHFPIMARINF